MVLIPHFRTQNHSFLNPYVKPTILDTIIQKLEVTNYSYKLQKPAYFIPEVKASQEFEQAASYAVVNFDSGQILAEKKLSQKYPIASLTKIMTSVVALDLASPDEKFEVSEKAASEVPTKVMLKPGEKYTLRQLLSYMLMSSANDAAQVVKEGIDKKYGEEIFIKAMNIKAKELGLKNSRFTNPQGFDNPDHYSTVEDLAYLSHYVLSKYPLIAQIASMEVSDQTQSGADMRFYLQNWNGLLGVYPGINGLKIGNTNKAGYTTIVTSKREGKTILVVLLGAPGVLQRDLWASQLLDLGFGKAANLAAVNLTEDDLKEKYAGWKYFK